VTADQPPPTVEIVVVRPARLPPSAADAAFSIIQLRPEVLEITPRLDEALEDVPGVSLFRRTSSLGANPTTQGVALRGIAGSGASRALVTLDGVPQNDPFGGWVIWTRLPSEAIGAATIVRGAGAGPYGAGALTGVVSLQESDPPVGDWMADVEGGSLGQARGAGTAELAVGPGALFLAGSAEHSDGWIPVGAGRGAADTRLWLDDGDFSARYQADVGAAVGAFRLEAYQEERGSGLVGAESRERGASLSAIVAQDPSGTGAGWRAQAWTQVSDLFNTSVSVAADRSSTTLTNDQYATPAIGYGANLAVRWLPRDGSLELGVDVRGADGQDEETYDPVAGALTYDRHAGGQTLTGGAYGEATHQSGPWLFVLGARVDGWSVFDSHRLEQDLLTGATTLDLHPPARAGVLPSARAGVRYDIDPAVYLRAAAYAGFRAPTLNELYRPFRVGNNVTEANSDLTPERLYGAEAGAGGAAGPIHWNATGFYNQLANPVLNVTLLDGPYYSPLAGYIPPGGVLLERENAGAINAYGLESDASARLTAVLTMRAAVDWTYAIVDGGSTAPQLTGLRPAETPRVAATWDLSWRAASRLILDGDLRYESARFDDDQNLHRLGPATTVDARAEWRLTRNAAVFIAVDNLFDVAVATGQTATYVTSYGPPRTVMIGFRVSGADALR